jgi:phenylacetaldehyde dehydrogenase
MTTMGAAGLTLPIGDRGQHFIGGEWVSPSGGDGLDVEDPATGERIGTIAAGGSDDVDRAVETASAAMAAARSRRWGPAQRQDALLALASVIEVNAEELATIEALDAGKPISNSRRIDIPASAAILRYFAGWATKLAGETMELAQGGSSGFTLREPVGVVGQIIPWNYPLMGAAFKIGPAIAAGCASVLKPAEQSSLSALRLAELSLECGFPPGFLNVVTGTGPRVGAGLVAHPEIAKISFTGSTATGTSIAADCARAMKRVTVELGGKSPVVVMPDADLDAAAQGIAMSIFLNTGQTCSAGSRLFVHASVAKALSAKIAAIGAAMTMSGTMDPSTQLGPAISAVQRDRILSYVEGAVREGARAVCAGRALPKRGYYVEPTLLADVHPSMTAVQEEIFGPVLCVLPFETLDLDEIAALANDTRYGLAAYVWTRSLATAHGLVARLRAGTVRINGGGGSDLSMPAGGVRQSGFGRENGRAGVEAYTELKSVTMVY